LNENISCLPAVRQFIFFFKWDSIADILVLPATNFNLSDMTSEAPTGWSVDKIKGKPLMRMKKRITYFISLSMTGH